MAPGEFELIERYFTGRGASRGDVRLGVGDDAAIVAPPAGSELVLALDTIVSGVHFPADTNARCVGHRVLAVNLSDLAAMGAIPAWALLGLTMPAADDDWLGDFAAGLDGLAQRFGVALVGGDTTRGPLVASLMLAGFVPPQGALRRAGARPDDDVWISGTVGDAGAGLAILQGRLAAEGAARDQLLPRFLLPEPHIRLGQALRGFATACIDVSDGLAADLGKLCGAGRVGARVDAGRLPLSGALLGLVGAAAGIRLGLSAGDDYELLFTAPPATRRLIDSLDPDPPLTCIGVITAAPGVRLQGIGDERDAAHGFDHFGGRPDGPG